MIDSGFVEGFALSPIRFTNSESLGFVEGTAFGSGEITGGELSEYILTLFAAGCETSATSGRFFGIPAFIGVVAAC